jgi:hypothetical protein
VNSFEVVDQLFHVGLHGSPAAHTLVVSSVITGLVGTQPFRALFDDGWTASSTRTRYGRKEVTVFPQECPFRLHTAAFAAGEPRRWSRVQHGACQFRLSARSA